MDIVHAILLAIVQGVTEFLPISSSAHLILLPLIMHWRDQGLVIDVAAHFGSLFAVIFYLRKQLKKMIGDWLASFSTRRHAAESRLFWYMLVASVPVFTLGFFLKEFVEQQARNPTLIAIMTIVFALALWFADAKGRHRLDNDQMCIRDAILIGCAQAIALIPGISRSGITMTTSLMLGYRPAEAARFSFLLAIPVILAAMGLESVHLFTLNEPIAWHIVAMVMALSGVCAWFTMDWLLRFVERVGMLPFVIYRLILGAFILLMM